MAFFVRLLRLLSMAIWVGGIAFFAFVVAPVAFAGLPSSHEAGIVVRGTLLWLHRIGIGCGVVFLGASLLSARRWDWVGMGLVAGMLGVTVFSQESVLPRMEVDRGGGEINALPVEDARRVDFERLHTLSERLEGSVLLLGIGVVGSMARKTATEG